MNEIVILKVLYVVILSAVTFFFIKPKKKLTDWHLFILSLCVIAFSLLNAHFFGKKFIEVILLINTTGAGKSIVLGYGLLIGVSLRILLSKKIS